MLTERFNRLWDLLVVRWFAYQDAPRDPARVTRLAAARVALGQARSEIAVERGKIVATTYPGAERSRVAIPEADLRKLRVSQVGWEW
jgi:hypothetical protein